MAADAQRAGARSLPNGAAVAVVLVVAGVIALIAYWTFERHSEAADVAAILGVVVSPLAGLGAAAFGLQLQAAAKAETQETKRGAARIAERIGTLLADGGAEGREGVERGRRDAELRDIQQQLRRLAS